MLPVEARADRVMRFTVYLERLLPENVCHLTPVEQVFSDGPQQIRRWTLLSALNGAAALFGARRPGAEATWTGPDSPLG